MNRFLHISVSPRGDNSYSRYIAEQFIEAMRALHSEVEIVERDLAAEPLPHIDAAFARATLTPAGDRSAADQEALRLSDALIAELEAADGLLISTPMHNFALPSVLKAWLDHIIRPNRTFRPSSKGKLGLVADRPTFVILACGGGFEGDVQEDHFSAYMRYALRTTGIEKVQILRLEELNRGHEKVVVALENARRWIHRQLVDKETYNMTSVSKVPGRAFVDRAGIDDVA
ncbi:MAG TPA: NAD(P)H-dependent oxidoreductase [Rhodocyclaceae bacterium]